MTSFWRCRARGQDGYTLIEVVITVAIASIVLSALTSVILTSVRAADAASSRVEASSQVRSFEFLAYDDFASAQLQGGGGCTQASPCTTQPIVLTGTRVGNGIPPLPAGTTVTYTWDGSSFVNRQASGGALRRAATNVTSFAWFVDNSGAFATLVLQLTVTVSSYQETQTFLFYPRVNP